LLLANSLLGSALKHRGCKSQMWRVSFWTVAFRGKQFSMLATIE